MWVNFWTLFSVLLTYISVLSPVTQVLIISAFFVIFETSSIIPSTVLFFRVVLAILGHLHLHITFRISFSTQKPAKVLIGMALNLQIIWGIINILLLSLLICEHNYAFIYIFYLFHLFMYCQPCFIIFTKSLIHI